MTPHLPPYPVHRPSGVDWLGDVPAHWEVLRPSKHRQCSSVKAGYGISFTRYFYQSQPLRAPEEIRSASAYSQESGLDRFDRLWQIAHLLKEGQAGMYETRERSTPGDWPLRIRCNRR